MELKEEHFEQLAKDMGLDFSKSRFITDMRKESPDIDNKGLRWEDCDPQQRRTHFLYWIIAAEEGRPGVKTTKIFQDYKKQYLKK
ncbi:MAG: hypothetical protein AAGA80_20955 [Cyanobacteria bacterium P01_F01_bin.143]